MRVSTYKSVHYLDKYGQATSDVGGDFSIMYMFVYYDDKIGNNIVSLHKSSIVVLVFVNAFIYTAAFSRAQLEERRVFQLNENSIRHLVFHSW